MVGTLPGMVQFKQILVGGKFEPEIIVKIIQSRNIHMIYMPKLYFQNCEA